jgi:hypothetical protein
MRDIPEARIINNTEGQAERSSRKKDIINYSMEFGIQTGNKRNPCRPLSRILSKSDLCLQE